MNDKTYDQAEDILNDTQHVQAWDKMGGHALEKQNPNDMPVDHRRQK